MTTPTLLQKTRYTFELVKFSHTLFALPFALSSFFIATRGNFSKVLILWVMLCVLFARSAAMAFNRLVDARWDALNPRTKNRHIPQGVLNKSYVVTLTIVSAAAFLFCSAQINRLTLLLAPLCLGVLFFYSFAKRFTHYSQFILGFCLGMAPVGAAIAATGRIDTGSLWLGTAVLFWVAGFDLLYALQDLEFDRHQGLHSFAVKLGIRRSFRVSALLHAFFLAGLAGYGFWENLGKIYWCGLGISAGLLLYQHAVLKEDLRKIQTAFFTANGLLSFFFLLFVLLEVYWGFSN
ncbi:MAG TPA: 4-hydroxybenzoate octaprenyltransferase [Deltaproteobacteria bacterium]|nr:4-hydroxybenzoate octaprenyltransferase [Deltaproteobacteria bacterium]